MVKTVAFDLGGVIMTIDNEEPKRRFKELGVTDIEEILDPYVQSGFFGDLEAGKITEEEYRVMLSNHVGKELTWAQCQYAWTGYVVEVPQCNLDFLEQLRGMGYRVVLASNANGFIQDWADSERFSSAGLPISHYFDRMYRSYEMLKMKPSGDFFRYILAYEKILPGDILFVDDSARNCASASEQGFRTFCPMNGEDWTGAVMKLLEDFK